MAQWLSWVCSATGGLMLYLMGRKSKWGPRIGLASQTVWIVYVLSLGKDGLGLLPGVILYTLVHILNIYKWERGK